MKKERNKSAYKKLKITNSIPTEDYEVAELHYQSGNIFADETMEGLIGLGEILRKIHNRLLSDGWKIKDSIFTPPESD